MESHGYILNELANLPIDEKVNFYIFVVNGQYREPLYEMIQSNFVNIAQSIGNHAVIATGTDSKRFTTEVARQYLGTGNSDASFTSLLPALLITNEHPDRLDEKSLRLIVPLRDAETRFGNLRNFFELLSQFVRGENNYFISQFENKSSKLGIANRIIGLRPGMFGISLNINELIDWWDKRQAERVSK